jgi:hypothetical protein
MMADYVWKFSVIQSGQVVASGQGPDKEAILREAYHYGMMYRQDGAVTVQICRVADDCDISQPGKTPK